MLEKKEQQNNKIKTDLFDFTKPKSKTTVGLKFPEWVSKQDLEVYNSDNLVLLGLVLTDTRENIRENMERIYKHKDVLDLHIKVKSNTIDFNPNINHNNLLYKTAGIKVEEGSPSVQLRLSIISLGNPFEARESFRRLLEQNRGSLVLKFLDITKDDYIRYMTGKTGFLSFAVFRLEE